MRKHVAATPSLPPWHAHRRAHSELVPDLPLTDVGLPSEQASLAAAAADPVGSRSDSAQAGVLSVPPLRRAGRKLLNLEKVMFVADADGMPPGVLALWAEREGVHRDGPGGGPKSLTFNIGACVRGNPAPFAGGVVVLVHAGAVCVWGLAMRWLQPEHHEPYCYLAHQAALKHGRAAAFLQVPHVFVDRSAGARKRSVRMMRGNCVQSWRQRLLASLWPRSQSLCTALWGCWCAILLHRALQLRGSCCLALARCLSAAAKHSAADVLNLSDITVVGVVVVHCTILSDRSRRTGI